LIRLQHDIQAQHHPRHDRYAPRWVWAGALALPLLALAIALPLKRTQPSPNDAVTNALRQALPPPAPAHGIHVAHGAAIQLDSGQANVRLYLVQTASAAPHGGSKAPR
jgi:hypothetical protein